MRKRESRQLKDRECRQCGKSYEAEFGAKDWFCSDQCKVRGRRTIDPRTGCWNATAKPTCDGYVRIQIGMRRDNTRRKVLLHRFAYESFVGPIPEDQRVCHICDNRICCNPLHLFLGSDQDNQTDSQRKGRKAKKLRSGDIQAIRELHKQGVAVTTIAHQFKVSWGLIYQILRDERWTHVK
jgi:hypothetical protein